MVKARLKPDQTLDLEAVDVSDPSNYDETLAEILSEFDASPAENEYNVKVYRIPVRPDGTGIRGLKPEYLFEGDKSVVPGLMDYCRDTEGYGTGTYRAVIRLNNQPYRQFDFRVFKPGTKNTSLVPAINSNDNALAPVVERLLSRMERLEEKITAPAPQTDKMAELKIMSEIMANLRGPAPEPVRQNESMKETLTLVTTILTLSDKMAGRNSSAGDTSWMDIIGKAIDNGAIQEIAKNGIAIGSNATSNVRPNPAPPPTRQIPPQDHPQTQPEKPPAPETIPATDMVRLPVGNGQFLNIPAQIHARLNECVITLCRRARANQTDPEHLRSQPFGYVDFVLDELEEIDSTGSLSLTLAGQENSLDLLLEAFPVTVPYREWFAVLLTECRKAIQGDESDGACEDSDTGDTAGFDPRNTQDHASFDPSGEAEPIHNFCGT